MNNLSLLSFEWKNAEGQNQAYVLNAGDFLGVSSSCPFGNIPGIPGNIIGLCLWQGRLLPVPDLSASLGESYKNKTIEAFEKGHAVCLILKTSPEIAQYYQDSEFIAIAIPSAILTYVPIDDKKDIEVIETSVQQLLGISGERLNAAA